MLRLTLESSAFADHATVIAGLCCYAASRYSNFVYGNQDISSRLHCLLHGCGNLGNVILYDSLGANLFGLSSRKNG